MFSAETGFTQAYAFTVTIKPTLFRYVAEDQYDKTSTILLGMLRQITPKVTLIAEMTKNKNIHYHGIIKYPKDKCRDVIKHFKDTFRRTTLFGFVDIKVMSDEEGWIQYIIKDFKESYEVLCRRPLIHDGMNVVDAGLFIMYGILLN